MTAEAYHDERGLLLCVVLPIRIADAPTCCTSDSCEKVWLRDRSANVNDELELKSDCTEEEKVAVEQLAALRHIRDLSMQADHSADDCSCSTESSPFNERVTPNSLTSSRASGTCEFSMGSPATSSSAACSILDAWHLMNQQERPKDALTLGTVRDGKPNFKPSQALAYLQPGTHSLKPIDVDVDVDDDDDRQTFHTRLLSELYQDQSNALQPARQATKRRRKAMKRIMEANH